MRKRQGTMRCVPRRVPTKRSVCEAALRSRHSCGVFAAHVPRRDAFHVAPEERGKAESRTAPAGFGTRQLLSVVQRFPGARVVRADRTMASAPHEGRSGINPANVHGEIALALPLAATCMRRLSAGASCPKGSAGLPAPQRDRYLLPKSHRWKSSDARTTDEHAAALR